MDSIKLLVLEDSKLDAELIVRELRHFDQPLIIKIVSTKPEFEELVLGWDPDIIVSDFNLKSFNGNEALTFARQNVPNTPFITLSGSVTPDMEVTLLKNRANDILSKDNLKRLPFAIQRVLNERRDKQKLDSTLYELAGNLKFQEALTEVSLIFNSSEPFEIKMQRALKTIGLVINVSRVYLFEENEKGKTYTNTFEWCAKGVKPQIENLKDVPYSETPSFRPMMINNEGICTGNIFELPQGMIDILEPQNIKALMIFPLYISDQFFGFIGVDENREQREWSSSENKLLKSVSGIISNAYSEYLAQLELLNKNEELNQLLKEKEVLVGEVHHRVKNNLALISSFLQLEQLGVTTTESKQQIISANILRIKSIGIVHETVYQLGSFSNIDVLDVLAQIIEVSYTEKVKMKPEVNINRSEDPVTFNINIAVPFSLLISELMFQVLSLSGEDEFIATRNMCLSTVESDTHITVTIGEPDLAGVILKLQQAHKFSEIVGVLAKQIKADIRIDIEQGRTHISFVNKKVKGSSSSLGQASLFSNRNSIIRL